LRETTLNTHIVPAYAALLGLFFIALSIRTLRLRRQLRIAVGDGGNPAMLRAMRVHANFAEYVPLGLILLHFVEAQGAQAMLLHGLCLCLLLGRVAHAFGVSQTAENFSFRVTGMALTFTTIFFSSAWLLLAFVRQHLA
jgi:uncharacterized membrane protein YecN with MAPEG domain